MSVSPTLTPAMAAGRPGHGGGGEGDEGEVKKEDSACFACKELWNIKMMGAIYESSLQQLLQLLILACHPNRKSCDHSSCLPTPVDRQLL